VHSLEQRYRSL